MNEKQKRFAEEYIIDLNATQAAARAGYSRKTAYSSGHTLLKHAEVKEYIHELMKQRDEKTIAKADEVLRYLTSVMRGEAVGTEILPLQKMIGQQEVEHVLKNPSEKEKLRAAELLGKRYGLFDDEQRACDKNEALHITMDYGDDIIITRKENRKEKVNLKNVEKELEEEKKQAKKTKKKKEEEKKNED